MGTVRYFLLSHCSNTTESVRESIQKPIAQEACIILQMGKLSHSCLHQQNPRHRATGSSNLNPPLSWKTQRYLAQEMFSTDFKAARNSLPDLSFLGFAACKWCVLRPGTEQGPKTTTSEDRSLFVTALKADMGWPLQQHWSIFLFWSICCTIIFPLILSSAKPSAEGSQFILHFTGPPVLFFPL